MLVQSPTTPIQPPALPDERTPGIFRRITGRCLSAFRTLFGFITLVLGLAVISVIPILNLISLGYLLEGSGRVARSGRLRDGFIGLREFSTLGRIILASWLWFLPVRLIHSFWQDAELIEAGSQSANNLRVLLAVMIVLVTLHLLWAMIRGGKIRHFLWPAPVRFIRWLGESHSLRPFIHSVKAKWNAAGIPALFWLGLRGFAGAAIWLALPLLIMIAAGSAQNNAVVGLGSLFGGILLGFAVLYVPFLQTHFAMTGDFRDFLSLKPARQLFRRAPFAFWIALFVTLLFAIPLYLLKIELAPREVAWLPNVLFVLFIFPARLLLGWAVSRAEKRESASHWTARWITRLGFIPVSAAYVFVVWSTQYLSWHGTLSLLEQHAFLVPAPIFGL
ncbi:MAG: hypothetical protein P1U86_02600 [Verrucomicrobiales bacterium]|nr:hypothetical protein [Verrucomicrobiales bacterium]